MCLILQLKIAHVSMEEPASTPTDPFTANAQWDLLEASVRGISTSATAIHARMMGPVWTKLGNTAVSVCQVRVEACA